MKKVFIPTALAVLLTTGLVAQEASKQNAPKVEEKKVEAPKVDAPKAEEKKVEAPKVEAPKAEEKKAAAPAAHTDEKAKPAAPVAVKTDAKKPHHAHHNSKADNELTAKLNATTAPVVAAPAVAVAPVA